MPGAKPWVVLKFGGTSVSSIATWRVIEAIVRARLAQDTRPLVVHSALAGVSNRLEAIAAGSKRSDHDDPIASIERQHRMLADALGVDGEALLAPWLSELRQLATGVRLLGEASPKTHARLMALGELMSTSLGAAYLAHRGIATRFVDARECLVSERAAIVADAAHYLSAQDRKSTRLNSSH